MHEHNTMFYPLIINNKMKCNHGIFVEQTDFDIQIIVRLKNMIKIEIT